MSVILINPFEVPASSADEFVSSWEAVADYMKQQPGFVGTRLHRALTPNARFGFVNVAEWESPQHFMNAVRTPEFQQMSGGAPPNFPALYEIVKVSEDPGPRQTGV